MSRPLRQVYPANAPAMGEVGMGQVSSLGSCPALGATRLRDEGRADLDSHPKELTVNEQTMLLILNPAFRLTDTLSDVTS
jgi:hypothetical protein